MSRILVTGAAGFICSWLCEALRDKGHKVFGADSCVGGRNTISGVPLLVGDLADHAFARHVAEAVRPEILVHGAADPREGASWYRVDSVTRNNMTAYASILEACLRATYLDRVLLFSSMSVYGDQSPPFTEEMPTRPVDPYGVNKAAMEELTKQMALCHEFKWSIVRPHNVIQCRQFCDPVRNVAMIFCNSAARGEPLRIFGDGSQTRAFSNLKDSLPCYVAAITGASDESVVNIGGEHPVTVQQLADEVVRHFPEARTEYVPSRYGEVINAFCDHTKAKRLLGFREINGWKNAIADMAKWTKSSGPWDWEPISVSIPSKHIPSHWSTDAGR